MDARDGGDASDGDDAGDGTGAHRPPVPACPVEPGLPGCDAGPGGRLVFVARELRAACRGRRRRGAHPET